MPLHAGVCVCVCAGFTCVTGPMHTRVCEIVLMHVCTGVCFCMFACVPMYIRVCVCACAHISAVSGELSPTSSPFVDLRFP